MNRATKAVIAAVILAAFASAQDQAPEPPQAPAAPAAPRTPKAPRAPRAPRAPQAHSYLGIDSCDITPEIASKLHLPNTKGVEVLMVDQDAPAGKAGLKEHDVIVRFNGKTVSDPNELRNMIRDVPPGNTVTVGVVRDSRPMDLKVTLAQHPEFSWNWNGTNIHIPPIHIPPIHIPPIDVPTVIMATRHNGLTVEPLTSQLAEAFGAKDGRGLLIRSVEKNSPAEAAGFRAGDVIVRVGNESIKTINDWNQALRHSPTGSKLNVTVIREKREQNLTLAVPEERKDSSAINVDFDMGDLYAQLAQIGPEVQKSMDEWQKEWNSAENQANLRKQIEQAQREARQSMRVNQAEIQKQVEQARREAEKARKEWQKEWQKQREEWQKESQQNNDDQ